MIFDTLVNLPIFDSDDISHFICVNQVLIVRSGYKINN